MEKSQFSSIACRGVDMAAIWESNLAAPQTIKPGAIAQLSHSSPRYMPIRNDHMYIGTL